MFLLELFCLFSAGKSDDAGIAHHWWSIASYKIYGPGCINELGGEIIGNLHLFNFFSVTFQIVGCTCQAAEHDFGAVFGGKDVPGMAVLIDPHSANLAIWPRLGCKKGWRCNQQKNQKKEPGMSRIL